MTPVEEVMRGLDDLVRSGKILYVGISDTPAWVVSQANTMADLRGWSRFVALQVQYSLVERAVERDLLPMARALDLAVTPWGALAAGVLSGKYNRSGEGDGRASMQGSIDEKKLEVARVAGEVAREMDCSTAQVALSWVRQQPGVVIPILGARTVAQVEDNLKCVNCALNDDQLARLSTASAIDLGFPHDFLSGEMVRALVTAAMDDKIDNHRA
jgi:aryl-alcohol dehydrogenase-like predicted oxidoreductase